MTDSTTSAAGASALGMIAHGAPPRYLTFRSLAAVGVPHLVTTRHCPGVTPPAMATSPLSLGAGAVLAEVGLDVARTAWAKQVHGRDVARVEGPGAAGAVDVFVTRERGLALCVFTADCVPVTLVDVEAGVLALAHVGWRGCVAGAVQAALDAARDAGASPARLHATVGPAIGRCCYEVDAPVIDAFAGAYGARAEGWMTPARPGHVMLDLPAAVEALLAGAGVGAVESPRLCTACHLDLLYSHRKGHRGRLVSVAALP
jgi:YfiH family protein